MERYKQLLEETDRWFVTVQAECSAEMQCRRGCALCCVRTWAPELRPPYLLTNVSEADIDEIIEAVGNVRCPFLGDRDECLIYECRPLACRMEGLPMVDHRDGLIGDWCELNFTGEVSPSAEKKLARDHQEIGETEARATSDLALELFGERQDEVTVFIPSVAAEFESFWKPLPARKQQDRRPNAASSAGYPENSGEIP